ncbi:hypothetical protein ABH922_005133 [Rhodococcus sp. 27YEA15]|uniref:hypothetical protein n=1 Tax=Rhodococcus sp. 27YEA15 TaxID=3156259 RepID=UPI003C7AC210
MSKNFDETSPDRAIVGEKERLRWAAMSWARDRDARFPVWMRERQMFGTDTDKIIDDAHRLLMLLTMVCELPTGRIVDYDMEDWALVLGQTPVETVDAADLLSSMELSWRVGELTRPNNVAIVDLPIAELMQSSNFLSM